MGKSFFKLCCAAGGGLLHLRVQWAPGGRGRRGGAGHVWYMNPLKNAAVWWTINTLDHSPCVHITAPQTEGALWLTAQPPSRGHVRRVDKSRSLLEAWCADLSTAVNPSWGRILVRLSVSLLRPPRTSPRLLHLSTSLWSAAIHTCSASAIKLTWLLSARQHGVYKFRPAAQNSSSFHKIPQSVLSCRVQVFLLCFTQTQTSITMQ